MIKVRGSDPETVDLRDLGDKVYYGQEKVFSESQYSRSADLKRELQKGRLTVIERREEASADFKIPVHQSAPKETVVKEVVVKEVKTSDPLMELLLKKMSDLETGLKNKQEVKQEVKQEPKSEISNDLLNQILLAIKSAPVPTVATQDSGLDAIKGHLEKLSSKIEDLSLSSSENTSGKNKEITQEAIDKRMDEVYVPNVTVHDSNTNVNLEVRVINKEESMTDILAKLKKLKNG